jgi:bifunctional UDP-N-acetylglucosamine pyrophosphorylase/glucosamine-1-phosphate N-acetyltransferase
MSSRARAAIILAAGQGTRMKSSTNKVLHQVGGRALVDWALAATATLGCERTVTVVGAHAPEVGSHVEGRGGRSAVQDPPRGTGHAVLAAKDAMAGFDGDVAVTFGDTPLTRAETIEKMFALRAEKGGIVVLGFEPADPSGYGRLVRGADGTIERIVEHKDASAEELKIGLCNSGVLVADARELFDFLAQVKNDNAKKEYYLTDVVGIARAAGTKTFYVVGDESEVLGVNSRVDLAAAESAFQARARRTAMESGVTLLDPATTYFSFDTRIEPDVVIEPNVFFAPGVSVARGARINAFSHLESCEVGDGARIGPFARLRPKAKIGAHAHIGNFVEVKNVDVGIGAKANHLAYLGDGRVGARANIGAGTIFCNYDGFDKNHTDVGEDAFIGSNSALVAPVKIGARANVAAGSVITKDVTDDALGIGRGRQEEKAGWAADFRAKKLAAKGQKK